MHSHQLVTLAIGLAAVVTSHNTSIYQPRPFAINVSPTLIEQIRVKAAQHRPTLPLAAPDWFDGPPTANISAISRYVADEYNWWEYQDAINSKFPHYITTIPSSEKSYPHNIDLHFIHRRSERKDAIPILLLHGWPSTSLEWEKVVNPLADPQDTSKPAFHIVAPDLPGFGFSPAPVAPGLGGPGHAAIFASLMQQLGYKSYVVYSTDLGFIVAQQMIKDYEERIIRHVTDFYFTPPNATDLQRFARNQTTAEETRYINSVNAFFTTHAAYSAIHSTFPLSIAYALNDSPIGFLAWMWQLDFTVRDLSIPYSTHELVSQALLLLIPGVYGNIRSYKELFPLLLQAAKPSRVPTSVTQWGSPSPGYPELANYNFAPKDWVERTANVTFFKRYGSGGHFPAYTRSELWLEAIWDIFSSTQGYM